MKLVCLLFSIGVEIMQQPIPITRNKNFEINSNYGEFSVQLSVKIAESENLPIKNIKWSPRQLTTENWLSSCLQARASRFFQLRKLYQHAAKFGNKLQKLTSNGVGGVSRNWTRLINWVKSPWKGPKNMFSAMKPFAHTRYSCFAEMTFDIALFLQKKVKAPFVKTFIDYSSSFVKVENHWVWRKREISFPEQRMVALEFTEERKEMTKCWYLTCFYFCIRVWERVPVWHLLI